MAIVFIAHQCFVLQKLVKMLPENKLRPCHCKTSSAFVSHQSLYLSVYNLCKSTSDACDLKDRLLKAGVILGVAAGDDNKVPDATPTVLLADDKGLLGTRGGKGGG